MDGNKDLVLTCNHCDASSYIDGREVGIVVAGEGYQVVGALGYPLEVTLTLEDRKYILSGNWGDGFRILELSAAGERSRIETLIIPAGHPARQFLMFRQPPEGLCPSSNVRLTPQ